MKQLSIILSFLLTSTLLITAAEPANYYTSAEGKSANSLRLALQDIIDGHTVVSYKNLYNVYKTSDNTAQGKVWDMYSTCDWTHGSNQCGNYSTVCDCYNREHSVPQSWFGEASPMVSDAFHVYPTDGRVNGQRSNYPFGECSNGTTLTSKALGKLGSSTFAGYSGTVFEPADEYKGDFARTYFYMATRYAGTNFNKTSNGAIAFTSNADLTNYSIQLFMKWHREDPVSDKERVRNDAVYAHQHNRNPFIDYPELAEHIWGNKQANNWYINSSATDNVFGYEVNIFMHASNNTLNIHGINGDYQYSIFNIAGQIIKSDYAFDQTTISLPHLTNGIYLVKIVKAGKSITQKFIINN